MRVQKPVMPARRRELGTPGAPTARIAARGGSGVLAREARGATAETVAFAGLAGALIVAGGLVAAVNSATPFAHGSWLAAYLVLVGGVAQLALGAAPVVLPAPVSSTWLRRAQLALWNAGIAIVAAGVFADALAIVVAGSVLVLAALAAFAYGGGPVRPQAATRVMLYRLVILVLAVSVAIGSVLAGASPAA
jgi:hypothetical protein